MAETILNKAPANDKCIYASRAAALGADLERTITKLYLVIEYAELAHQRYNEANGMDAMALVLNDLAHETTIIQERLQNIGQGVV